MSLRRNIISLLMLLTYTLSFAHDIIPHCHSEKSILNGVGFSEQQDHEHSHEHIAVNNNENKDLVQHSGHADIGLFDYVVCLLESVDHGVTNNHEVVLSGNDDLQLAHNENVKSPLFYSNRNSFIEFEPLLKQTISNYYFNQQFIPPIIHLDCRILRGPPVFSC